MIIDEFRKRFTVTKSSLEFKLAIITVALILVLLQCQSSRNSRTNNILYQESFTNAKRLIKNGEFSKSLPLLKSICPTGHEKKEHCYLYASTLSKANDPKKAIDILENSIEINRLDFKAHRLLGYIYLAENQLNKSRYHSRIALKTQPNDKIALLNLARVLDLMDSPDSALMIYKNILGKEPNDQKTLHYQSLALFRKQEYKQAWESQTKITNQAPYICYFGELAYYADQNKKALSALEKCLDKSPERNSATWILSLSYLKAGLYQKACMASKRHYTSGDALQALPVLMICHYHLGEYKLADQYVQLLQEHKINNPDYLYYMALTKARVDEHNMAIKYYNLAIAKKPAIDARFNLGLSLEKAGQPDKALKNYKIACRLKDYQACKQVQRLEKNLQ